MDKTAKETLLDALCNQGERKLVDVKFFRGTADNISEEAFIAEVLSARAQRASGLSVETDGFPENFETVNLREVVASL